VGPTRDYAIRISGLGSGCLTKLGAALCLLLLLVYGMLWSGTVQQIGGSDNYVRQTPFLGPLTGALIVAGDRPAGLYDRATQQAAQTLARGAEVDAAHLRPFLDPPPVALALAPLARAGLPYTLLFTAWAVGATMAAGLCVGLLAGRWPAPQGTPWLLMLGCTSFLPLISSLMLGQNAVLALLGWVGATVALKGRRDALAGVAGALAGLQPASAPALLLALLVARRPRAALTMLAVWLGAALALTPLLGGDWAARYARFFWQEQGGAQGGAPVIALGAGALALALAAGAWSRWASPPPGADLAAAWDLRWALTLLAGLLPVIALGVNALPLAIAPAWIIGTHVATGCLPAGARRFWLLWLWLGYACGLAIALAPAAYAPLGAVWTAGALAGLCWTLRAPGAGPEWARDEAEERGAGAPALDAG
jgi:hypothetical protein